MDQQNIDQPASIDRRKFLAGTTAVTAAVWAAPSIVTIDRAFGADGSPTCTTSAYDMRGRFSGTVNGVLNPASSCADNGSEALADITSIAVGGTTIGSGRLLFADCDTGACCASAGVTDLVLTIPGLPVIGVALLNAEACCSNHTTTRSATLTGVTIGGSALPNPGPNTTISLGTFGSLILNEQSAVDEDTVNAFHLLANVPGVQAVDLVIGSATADC